MLRSTALVVMVAAIATAAAGCGGGSGARVARLGSTTTRSVPSPAGGSSSSQMLAYARCMRSHGVPTFPDPNGTGQIAKDQVIAARSGDPSRFDAANTACRHLAPNGGNGETPAQIAEDWRQFRQFAQCMRRRGVTTWPDPTNRSATDRRPTFDLRSAGLYPFTSQIRAKVQSCETQVHLGGPPPAG